MGDKRKCERCNGRMFMDSFQQPCDQCKETGAQTCRNCWVHLEWGCVNCGHVVYMPRRRRHEVYGDAE